MPVYNREGLITNAIKSVLNQTYKNFELIIIDDGSSDKTCENILKIKDKRIKLIRKDVYKRQCLSIVKQIKMNL